jgi:hypothetical protein
MCLAWPTLSLATTRYVDNTTTACSTPSDTDYSPATETCGGGGTDLVYNTIAAALAVEVSGDTIEIRGGVHADTYTVGIDNDIASGPGPGFTSVTTVRGYNGEVPIIRPTGNPSVCGVFIRDKTSIVIQDLDLDASGCTSGGALFIGGGVVIGNTAYIRAERVITRGATGSGILIGGNNLELLYGITHSNGTFGGNQDHGIYWSAGTTGLIRGYTAYNNMDSGIQLYPNPVGVTVEDSLIYANATNSASWNVYFGCESCIFRRNVIAPAAGDSGIVVSFGSTNDNNILDHNSIYGGLIGLRTGPSANNTRVRNNLILGATTAIENAGTNTTLTTNRTTGTATDFWTDPANNDMTLKAGVAAIDAGTAIAGYSYNEAAPDQGAFESFKCTSGLVTGNVLTVQCDMALDSPLVVGAMAGWTVNNGRTVTAAVLSGSSAAALTFDGAACTGVQTWQVTYTRSPGTATAGVGRIAFKQPLYSFGPLTVTNNCAGASYTITQTEGKAYAALGAQSTVALSTRLSAGGQVAIRIHKKVTGANAPAITTKVQCSTDDTNWADMPDAFAGGNCPNMKFVGLGNFPGMDAHNTPVTTERLTSEFGGMVAGGVQLCSSGCQTPAVQMNQDTENEMVWIVEADTDATGTYYFREVLVDGTVLTYGANSRPSISISPPSASGFASLQPTGLTVSPHPMWGPRPSLGWQANAEKLLSSASLLVGNGLK